MRQLASSETNTALASAPSSLPMFYGSDAHAESAAAIFTLIATCRLHQVEPRQYLGFWRERKANATALLRPVRVIDETSDASIVLLVRNGIRVEGLSVEQFVEVLSQVR